VLLYGDVSQACERAREYARAALERFEPDGTVTYKPSGSMDFGSTHWERHANGLTAPVVLQALQNALYAGDDTLIRQAIQRLRGLDRYVNSAPRGAQTWEVPLHTPDILASAYMVKAYLLGYEITGDRHFLNMARHWAWTGVPFVYLYPPTDQPVGLYATIPVFGATHWVAPNWMGLPVQWCGLVYSDALYRLSRYDSPKLWKRIADGITASGIQQSWPSTDGDLQALLPDSFALRSQTRNPVAINPGTVQANAIRLFGGPEIYDYARFRRTGVTVHAPGQLTGLVETNRVVRFRVRQWAQRPCYLLIHGVSGPDKVLVDGKRLGLRSEFQYDRGAHRLILRLSGSPLVEVRH